MCVIVSYESKCFPNAIWHFLLIWHELVQTLSSAVVMQVDVSIWAPSILIIKTDV